ncbi:MAG: two-component sensor histidine kinase [Desulfococcus sp. 4484_242]|nr:MAG: two-component sensor histidine kinase [Desulfococcus sp. 4484_242]
MWFREKIRRSFQENGEAPRRGSTYQFNYRRIWKLAVLLTGGVSLIPLIFITAVNYQAMRHAIESEMIFRTTRVVSNTCLSISFFVNERKSALNFIVHENTFASLNSRERLSRILGDLKRSFGGGFVDLGVVDAAGRQRNYVGPYNLGGKDYSGQKWFRQVLDSGMYISDVFLGYRKVPHLVIAVKGMSRSGAPYVLRAALSTTPFETLLSQLEVAGMGDVFMINHEGILQTPSRYHGGVFENIYLPVPKKRPNTEVLEGKGPFDEDLIIGYRYIDDTPFILMVVKKKKECMKPWSCTGLKLIVFLLVSVSVILTVILGTSTYLVKKIKIADEKRSASLHQVEYANKMASIGRLAASVAHEINNPLAIINEKAGLIKDFFTFGGKYAEDPKLMGLVDGILTSVKRAGTITRRLLNFSRNLQASVEPIHLREAILEVLGFMGKEAELREIKIHVDVAQDIPVLETDRGKLQQILLNIINNAFAAVSDGGHIDIRSRLEKKDHVAIIIADDGCGISKEDLIRIYEPFFSTKSGQGGTGLGLSITYSLVQEIGGSIHAESELGKGTRFTITIPIKSEKTKT